MKRLINLFIICSVVLLSSCLKDITDLNVDPNNPETVEPGLLFKYAVKRGMGSYLTQSHLEYNGLQQWIMYMATRGGIELGNAYPSPAGGDAFWNESYINAMNNAQVIIRQAEDDPAMVNMKAAATIWKSFLMSRVTDLWGDAPYSKALDGNPSLEFTPSYDSQKEIYHALLDDLATAVLSFNPDQAFFDEDTDLVFAGNIDLWIRFANSLRLRLAIRISSVEPDYASGIASELVSLPLIESNVQNASFQFNSIFNKPLYEAGSVRYAEGSAYINPSKFLVDLLVESSDPRTPFILEKTALSATFPFIPEYRGVPNLVPYNSEVWEGYNLDAQLGDPLGQWGDVSRIGLWYMNNDRPFPLFTYSEVCFLKAEAALLGWWSGDALELIKEGVGAHMDYINAHTEVEQQITTIDKTNFLNSITEGNLEEIITQKYLLFVYENVFEAYADYRRTGFPVLLDYEGNPINSQNFPKRLIYPYSEYTFNRENYQQAIEQQGPDNATTHLWWDIN